MRNFLKEAPHASAGQSTNDYALVKMTCEEYLSRPLLLPLVTRQREVSAAVDEAAAHGNIVVARLPGNRNSLAAS